MRRSSWWLAAVAVAVAYAVVRVLNGRPCEHNTVTGRSV